MHQAIEEMKRRLLLLLGDELTAFYLYGSVVLGDFKPGWSDIDMLCFTKEPVGEAQALALVNLRQTMLAEEPQNPYYRLFEGAIVSLKEFCSEKYTRVVYWGTSGQRVTDGYCFDAFSRYELLHDGLLVCGTDVRGVLEAPDDSQLKEAVAEHLRTIRRYAVQTNDSLYACGWCWTSHGDCIRCGLAASSPRRRRVNGRWRRDCAPCGRKCCEPFRSGRRPHVIGTTRERRRGFRRWGPPCSASPTCWNRSWQGAPGERNRLPRRTGDASGQPRRASAFFLHFCKLGNRAAVYVKMVV